MSIQERLYTAAEFWDMVQSDTSDTIFELVYGELRERNSSSFKHSLVATEIARLLGNFVKEHQLGFVLGADGGYTLSEEHVRVPDASFVSRSRMPADFDQRHLFSPDLAVEVISPSESSRDVHDKTTLYLKAGTSIVWNVYPTEEIVEIWRLQADGTLQIQALERTDTLNGGDVLAGFSVKVSELFSF
jgi:Uma2 family endonuclease